MKQRFFCKWTRNLVLVAIAIFWFTSFAQAARYFVKPTGGVPPNVDGGSWTNAFINPHYALAHQSLASGDEIWVAAGTYKPLVGPNSGDDRSKTFLMAVTGVKMYGGFAGTEASDPIGFRKRKPYVNITILSGDLGTANDPDDNAYHVVTMRNVNLQTVLDGFTITAGNAIGAPAPETWVPTGAGGGILIYRDSDVTQQYVSQPTIVRCTFDGNRAVYGGGGAAGPYDAEPMLHNCIFRNNYAQSQGGAFYNADLDPPNGYRLSAVSYQAES